MRALMKNMLGFSNDAPSSYQRAALRFLVNLDVGVYLRYKEIVRIIKKEKERNPSILEIGSGATGITSFLKRKVIGVDVNFDDTVSLGYLVQNKYNGQTLEYNDKSFDYVISVDMIEHVSKDKREAIISEMLRVTRKCMMLAFPCSRRSQLYEKKLERRYLHSGLPLPKYLREHLQYGLPEEKEIVHILDKVMISINQLNYKIKVIPNESVRVWYMHELMKSKGAFFYYSAMVVMKMVLFLLPFISSVGDCYRKIIIIEK